MHGLKPYLAALLFATLPLAAVGQPAETEKSQHIEQIIEAFNLKQRMLEIPEEVHTQFSTNPFGLPPDQNQRLMDIFSRAFHSDTLMEQSRKVLRRRYDAAFMDSIRTRLQHSDTRKVLEAEEETYTIQGLRKRIVREYQLEKEPPSTERRNLIGQLQEAALPTEMVVESYSILFRSFLQAFSTLSEQATLTESRIKGYVDNYRTQIRPEIERELMNKFLVTYYKVDSPVIRNHMGFYETEAGLWLASVLNECLFSAYQAGAARFNELAGDAK